MKDIDDFNPWEMIVGVLVNNGYSVRQASWGLEVAKNGETCTVFLESLTHKPKELDEMFIRIESEKSNKHWIPLSLHDPAGFDEALKQLEEALRPDE